MRVAIAGIRGFIGQHLKARLEADGHKTIGVERQWARTPFTGVDAFVWAGGPSRHVETLSAVEAGIAVADWTLLLDIMARNGPIHAVLLSSHAVYGRAYWKPPGEPYAENEPLRPTSLYGALQASREHMGMAMFHSKRLPFTALRLSTVYGPGMREDALVRVFIDAALKGSEIRLEGGGKQIRPFIHVEDVAVFVARVLAAGGPAEGNVFNIVADHAAVATLARECSEAALALGRPGARIVTTKPRPAEPGNTVLDSTKAARLLGWCSAITLDRGIPLTAAAMLAEVGK